MFPRYLRQMVYWNASFGFVYGMTTSIYSLRKRLEPTSTIVRNVIGTTVLGGIVGAIYPVSYPLLTGYLVYSIYRKWV